MSEDIKELIRLAKLGNKSKTAVSSTEGKLICDHRVIEANGMIYTFRNRCELCGKDMKAN
jgi:hypothetical protein